MSKNVDRVRAGYDAFSRGDLDGAVQFLHPEVEVRTAIESLEYGNPIHGRAGVRAFWESLRVWETMRVEILEVIEAGDRVLLHERWHVRGSQDIELEISDLYTFEGGLIVRVDGFTDKAEAEQVMA
jgi:ketosteroid isomerase-like protein